MSLVQIFSMMKNLALVGKIFFQVMVVTQHWGNLSRRSKETDFMYFSKKAHFSNPAPLQRDCKSLQGTKFSESSFSSSPPFCLLTTSRFVFSCSLILLVPLKSNPSFVNHHQLWYLNSKTDFFQRKLETFLKCRLFFLFQLCFFLPIPLLFPSPIGFFLPFSC